MIRLIVCTFFVWWNTDCILITLHFWPFETTIKMVRPLMLVYCFYWLNTTNDKVTENKQLETLATSSEVLKEQISHKWNTHTIISTAPHLWPDTEAHAQWNQTMCCGIYLFFSYVASFCLFYIQQRLKYVWDAEQLVLGGCADQGKDYRVLNCHL